jgi:hypothetical protein
MTHRSLILLLTSSSYDRIYYLATPAVDKHRRSTLNKRQPGSRRPLAEIPLHAGPSLVDDCIMPMMRLIMRTAPTVLNVLLHPMHMLIPPDFLLRLLLQPNLWLHLEFKLIFKKVSVNRKNIPMALFDMLCSHLQENQQNSMRL